ncbi:MAG TPA: PEP-CTERM sorting domain-containing protein [Acidobacteriaceae bacterium]|nr:PEP-CTERM sorting domain-containing protein [Acidobacteriaceae bacterium]
MKNKLTIAAMTLLLTLGLSSAAACADTVIFTLNPSTLSGHPGDTVTFTATVSAPVSNGADIFLSGPAFSLGGPIVIDSGDFFNNAPFSLSAGDSSVFDIFTAMIPLGSTMTTFGGSVQMEGGADFGALGNIGDPVNFAVVVTPEPSSFLLLGSGLVGLVGVLRRKRSM